MTEQRVLCPVCMGGTGSYTATMTLSRDDDKAANQIVDLLQHLRLYHNEGTLRLVINGEVLIDE